VVLGGAAPRGFEVFDITPPRLARGLGNRPAAIGATIERVGFLAIHVKQRPSARAFVAGLATGFGLALFAGGLEIRRDHARRRGRVGDARIANVAGRRSSGVVRLARQRAEFPQRPDDERLVRLGNAARACRRQREQFLRGQPCRHRIGRYPIRGVRARLFALDAERNEVGSSLRQYNLSKGLLIVR